MSSAIFRHAFRPVARILTPRMSLTTARAYSSKPTSPPYADPYPLPLQSDELINGPTLEGDDESHQDLLPERLPRYNESEETLRARLTYQSRKRGTLENDLLLATFAREWLPKMSVEEMTEFDQLMDEPDWNIYYWAIDKRAPPERWANSPLLEKLRVHARNEGKVVRRMPDVPHFERSSSQS